MSETTQLQQQIDNKNETIEEQNKEITRLVSQMICFICFAFEFFLCFVLQLVSYQSLQFLYSVLARWPIDVILYMFLQNATNTVLNR